MAAERGLPFLRDVTVELADDARVRGPPARGLRRGRLEDLEVTGHVLQALGLVEPGTDLVEAMRSLLGAGVVGFYDPETDELVVRGTDADAVRPHRHRPRAHPRPRRPALRARPPRARRRRRRGRLRLHRSRRGQRVGGRGGLPRHASPPTRRTEASAEELEHRRRHRHQRHPARPHRVAVGAVRARPDLRRRHPRRRRAGTARRGLRDPAHDERGACSSPTSFLDGEGAVAVPPPTADGDGDRPRASSAPSAWPRSSARAPSSSPGSTTLRRRRRAGAATTTSAWLDGDRACLRANLVGDTPADTDEIASALEAWAASAPFDVEATVESAPTSSPSPAAAELARRPAGPESAHDRADRPAVLPRRPGGRRHRCVDRPRRPLRPGAARRRRHRRRRRPPASTASTRSPPSSATTGGARGLRRRRRRRLRAPGRHRPSSGSGASTCSSTTPASASRSRPRTSRSRTGARSSTSTSPGCSPLSPARRPPDARPGQRVDRQHRVDPRPGGVGADQAGVVHRHARAPWSTSPASSPASGPARACGSTPSPRAGSPRR